MNNYLTLLRKSDFTDLFKYGYLYIDRTRVVEFDGDIYTLHKKKDIQEKLLERVNQFDYSFSVLLVHFQKSDILYEKITIEEIQNIFALDEEGKREIEITYDPRILIQNPIWPDLVNSVQERFRFEDAKKGVNNIWEILKIEQPISEVKSILPDSDIMEIVREVQNDKRPVGDLSFWIYLLRYERHGFFPKTTVGYVYDLINVFINTFGKREFPSEVVENTDIFKEIVHLEDFNLIDLLKYINKSEIGRNFIDKINKIGESTINVFVVAILFLKFRHTFINGFNLAEKEKNILDYSKKSFPAEINSALYLLGIFLGNAHTFECLYDSLPLPIFKREDKESTNTISHKHNSSWYDKVLFLFDKKVRNYKNKDLLRKGLVETLLYLKEQGIKDGYILVTSLDNKEGWDKKPKPKAWKMIQEEFCPNYEEVRMGNPPHINPHINMTNEADLSNFYSKVEVNLFSHTDEEITDDPIDEVNVEKSHTYYKKDEQYPSFIYDEKAVDLVNSIGEIDKMLQQRLIKNIREIQKLYRPGGRNYNNNTQNNEEVINHFYNLCFAESNRYDRIEKTNLNVEIVSRLKNLLRSYYCGK